MKTERSKSNLSLWLRWFLASAMGYGIGGILGLSFAYGLFNRDPSGIGMGITLGTVMGATGGYFQWVVLRKRIAGAGLWGLASALGLGLAISTLASAHITVNYAVAVLLFALIIAAVSGILQWLILRRKVLRAGWWLLANLLGSVVGAVGAATGAAIGENTGNWSLAAITLGLAFGAGSGAITGAALVWLLSQAPSSNTEDFAAAH